MLSCQAFPHAPDNFPPPLVPQNQHQHNLSRMFHLLASHRILPRKHPRSILLAMRVAVVLEHTRLLSLRRLYYGTAQLLGVDGFSGQRTTKSFACCTANFILLSTESRFVGIRFLSTRRSVANNLFARGVFHFHLPFVLLIPMSG